MPGRSRIVGGGYPTGVILPGIDPAAIFFANHDRRFFVTRPAAIARTDAAHAYVQMTKQVQLLLTAHTGVGVATFMKRLGQAYVQYVNRKDPRGGPLFEGRFRS